MFGRVAACKVFLQRLAVRVEMTHLLPCLVGVAYFNVTEWVSSRMFHNRSRRHVVKALSIRQPWVELIFKGDKTIEYRSWKINYTGDLLIHASNAQNKDVKEDIVNEDFSADALVFGALVGVVEITGYTGEKGDFGWHLARPRHFQVPIPYKGATGIFSVPDDVAEAAVDSATELKKPLLAKKKFAEQGEAMLALIERLRE